LLTHKLSTGCGDAACAGHPSRWRRIRHSTAKPTITNRKPRRRPGARGSRGSVGALPPRAGGLRHQYLFLVLVAANIGNRSYSSYLSYLSDSSTRTLVGAEATPHRFVAVPCILPKRTRMELSPPIGASPCPSFQSYVAIRKHNVFFLVLHPRYPGFEASLRCRVSEVGVNPFESGRMKLAHEFAVGFFG
jgi:hypothetical protein